MKDVNKKCFICGEPYSDGIIVNGELICRDCENKIINTNPDEEDYDLYKDKIKVILFNQDIK